MNGKKKIRNALISVFHKDGLDRLVKKLNEMGVTIYSTGGTRSFIEKLGIEVKAVEDLTSYPSILGGRVKTLHPKVFGGILARQDLKEDIKEVEEFEIPLMDLVIVDLYPFESTVASGATESEIIEKIDIGGISLIRAAAKNYKDVLIISSMSQYETFFNELEENDGFSSIDSRKNYAAAAFDQSSHYDTAIFNYFSGDSAASFKQSIRHSKELRYGENPHQKGYFFGNFDDIFEQIHGKELSYNNLLDVDAAVHLMADFDRVKPTFAILKHNNACGLAIRNTVKDAYKAALAGDPVSAFGGILISNLEIDEEAANEMNSLFFEIVIAPAFSAGALEVLKQKKNRIILIQKDADLPKIQYRTLLNGVLQQDKDVSTEKREVYNKVTELIPADSELADLEFASILVKHTKSNAIVLAKNNQLLASGTGQTSRVDALNQAIHKAKNFGFDLKNAVMASDAFFPFPDCVEIAAGAGISSIVQPGGSIKDQDSIDACNKLNISMVTTGKRHFKH